MNIKPRLVTGVEVIGVNRRERSTVRSSGGGGFTYKGTGFTTPVNVSTTHKQWLEVWVKWPDGREDRLDFSGVDLLVREGHKLALLMRGNQIWAVKNFSTGITTPFVNAEQLVKPRMQFTAGWLAVRLWMASIIVFIFSHIFGNWVSTVGVIAIIGGVVVLTGYSLKSKKRWNSEKAEASKLLAEGFANLESARLDLGNLRAPIANG